MDKRFHRTAVEIAFNCMPVGYREKFLTDFSFDLLLETADIPYAANRFGEPEHLHLDHCYKLYLKGRDLHKIGEGLALEELVYFGKSVIELHAQDNAQLVRYNIAKGTHYIIDLGTFPHVNEATWDKYHKYFEDLAADWLDLHRPLIEELTKNYKPDPMRSVQNRGRAIAKQAYFDSIDFLPALKRNGQITDLQWATMCCKHIYAVMNWFTTFEKCL